MPQAIPYLAAYVYETAISWGASYAAAATIGTVVANVVVYGGMVAATAAAANAQSIKARRAMSSRGTTLSLKEPTASRKIVYGRQRIGGTTILMNTSGTDNKWAQMAVVHADHEVDGFETVYIGDDQFTPDINGNVVANSGYTYVKTHRGQAGQGVEGEMVTDTGGLWSSNNTVTGCAYSYMRLQWNSDKFPTGAPPISVILRGRKVWDPRDGAQDANDPSTWVWSENPALCILDYLRNNEWGLACDEDEIDLPSFIAAANTSDEDVYGGKRYTLNGVVDTADTPKSILEDMLTSCAGILVNAGGVWRLIVGADRPVAATFTLDHLRGGLSPQCGDSLRDTCNAVKGVYVSPMNQWQPADFIPAISSVAASNITAGARVSIVSIGDTDFTEIGAAENTVGHIFTATGPGTGSGIVDHWLGEDNGQRIWRDMELPFTIHDNEAHRHARIQLEKARQDISIPLQLNLAGLAVTVGDIVRLPFDRYGWNFSGGKLFEVTNWKYVTEQTEDGPLPGVDIVAREYAPGVWDDGPETTADLAPNTNLPNPFTVESVLGLGVSDDSYQHDDGTWSPRLVVTWSVANSEFILSGGKIQIEVKLHSASVWTAWSTQRGDAAVEYITDVKAGVSYDVRARYQNILGVSGAWAYVNNFTVPAPVAPSAPTGLTTSTSSGDLNRVPVFYAGAGGAKYAACMFKWTAPANKDIAYYEIRRNAGVPAVIGRTKGTETEFPLYAGLQINTATDAVSVRAVNRSAMAGAWATELFPVTVSSNYGTLGMAEQAPTGVSITGGNATTLTLVSATTITQLSSRRYKSNIRTIKDPLALVRKLRGVRYDQIDKMGGARDRFGFVAEELARSMPSQVERDARGRPDSVNYGTVVALLAEAVKALDQRTRPTTKRRPRRINRLAKKTKIGL